MRPPIQLALAILTSLLLRTFNLYAEPFTIGVAAPMTGELAEYGQAVRNGFALSLSETPDSSLNYIYEDNKYDAKEAVSSLRTLGTIKKVDLLYSWGEAPLNAIAPIVQQSRMPTVAMSLDAKPAARRDSIMIGINQPGDLIEKIYAHLRSNGFKKLCFVVSEDPFQLALLDEFKARAREGESIDIIATVQPQERDFKSIVTKISPNRGCETLGVYLLSGQVGIFYKELAKLNLKLSSFGTDVFESRAEIRASGPGIQGAIYPNLLIPAAFRERYLKRFGNDSQISYAYNTYMLGRWFNQLFNNKPKLTRPEVLEILKNADLEAPLTRTLSQQKALHINFPLVLRRVVGEGVEDL